MAAEVGGKLEEYVGMAIKKRVFQKETQVNIVILQNCHRE